MQEMITATGVVIAGTQAASGIAHFQDLGGSMNAQWPFFTAAGLALGGIHRGTINVGIQPKQFHIKRADLIVRQVKWHPSHSAEDFSFVRCELIFQDQRKNGYIYYPHPETKIGRFPGFSVIEVLAPFIPGVRYGVAVAVACRADQVELY